MDNVIAAISLGITSGRVYLHFYKAWRVPFRIQVLWSIIVRVEVDVEADFVPPSSWGVTAMSTKST